MFESLVARSRAAVRDGQPFVRLPEFDFAWAAAQRLFRAGDPLGWLTTVIGPRGGGKTRLVSQLLAKALERRPSLGFVIQSAGEWAELLQTQPIPPTATWPAIIVIEDADRTLGDSHDADLLARWLDELHRSGVRVLMTLSQPAGQATGLSPRLVSRLHAGLSARILELSPDSRLRFVREVAAARKIRLADAVAGQIAHQPPGTCRSLTKLLDRLVESKPKRAVIESIEELADGSENGSARLPLALIAAETAAEFGVPIGELRSEARDQALQLPRRCAMWLAHEANWSMAQIGRFFGRRTHASVSYSCRELVKVLDETPTLRERLQRLQSRLSSRDECG